MRLQIVFARIGVGIPRALFVGHWNEIDPGSALRTAERLKLWLEGCALSDQPGVGLGERDKGAAVRARHSTGMVKSAMLKGEFVHGRA